jgi:hypothetical protein
MIPVFIKWKIMEMDAWDLEYIDMTELGSIAFKKGGRGGFQFPVGLSEPQLAIVHVLTVADLVGTSFSMVQRVSLLTCPGRAFGRLSRRV